MAKPYKFRHVNEVAGAFVLAAVSLLLVVVVLMGSSQGWFTRRRQIKLLLPPEGTEGLREGADVRILGNVVGTVRKLRVPPDGRMEADASVQLDFAQFVRADSTALIRKPLGLGEPYVEIGRGTGRLLAGDEALPVASEPGATAVVEQAVREVKSAVADIRGEVIPAIRQAREAFAAYGELAADLRRPDGDLRQALANVKDVAASAKSGPGLAARILTDRELADEASKTVSKVNATIDDFHAAVQDLHRTTAALSEQSAQAIRQMQGILADMQKTTAALPETTRSVSRTADALPGLVLQMQETMRQIQRLVEGLQRSFLVRGSMAPDDTGRPIRPENVGSGGR